MENMKMRGFLQVFESVRTRTPHDKWNLILLLWRESQRDAVHIHAIFAQRFAVVAHINHCAFIIAKLAQLQDNGMQQKIRVKYRVIISVGNLALRTALWLYTLTHRRKFFKLRRIFFVISRSVARACVNDNKHFGRICILNLIA